MYTPGSPTPLWGVPLNPLGTEMDRLDSGGASAPPAIDAGIRQTYLYDLKSEGVRTVIVGPGTGEAQEVRFFTELLGGPGTSAGGVVVWNDVKP